MDDCIWSRYDETMKHRREANRPKKNFVAIPSAEMNAARKAFVSGQHEHCQTLCQQLLKRSKRDIRALHMMGLSLGESAQFDDAEKYFRKCLKIEPRNAGIVLSMARLSMSEGKSQLALQRLEKALKWKPGYEEAIIEMAALYERTGKFSLSRAALKRIKDKSRVEARKAEILGLIALHEGNFKQAVEATAHVVSDEQYEPLIRRRIAYLRGQAFDKIGDVDQAMEQWHLANRLLRGQFDPDLRRRRIDDEIAFFSKQFLTSCAQATNRSELPIFIAGLPRSGTTLVEQIIDAHPKGYGAGELRHINQLVNKLPERLEETEVYPRCLSGLTEKKADEIAEEYLSMLAKLASHSSLRAVNKSLENYRLLGLIALLFPGARVIYTRRDPVDTGLSIYMNEFHPQHSAWADLKHIGILCHHANRFMEHWKQVVDIPILEVHYEQLVADQEGESRRIIEFCGLEWDDRCLRFFESGRTVMTASYAQVAKPVYTSAIGRHKRYEKHLGPLLEGLREG